MHSGLRFSVCSKRRGLPDGTRSHSWLFSHWMFESTVIAIESYRIFKSTVRIEFCDRMFESNIRTKHLDWMFELNVAIECPDWNLNGRNQCKVSNVRTIVSTNYVRTEHLTFSTQELSSFAHDWRREELHGSCAAIRSEALVTRKYAQGTRGTVRGTRGVRAIR